jgi:hypothetical protein
MLQKLFSNYHFYGKVKMITNGPFVVESFLPLAHLIVITILIKRVAFETSLRHYEKWKI